MNIPENRRPVCGCGEKMKLIIDEGYYETLRYWGCTNGSCNTTGDMFLYKADIKYSIYD